MKTSDMSTPQNEELDKFKRRLIRTVSRFKEQKIPDLWDAVAKAMGKDCKSMWEHMRSITLKKLARLIACGDVPERLSPVARMSLTDWLFLDMVLVHDQIDVIEMDRPADELRSLRELFALVQAFKIEESPREDLAQRWSAATLHYNKMGRQCSPMLLQKRWHQLKASTRAHFYHYLNYGRKIVKQGKNVKIRPCKLHVLIARKYPDIVTKKLLTWEEMMSQNLLALPHELEEDVKMQKDSVSETNEPDLILMEPQVETINIDDESSDELLNEKCLRPSSESDSAQPNKLTDPTYSAEITTNCVETQTLTKKKHVNFNSYSLGLAKNYKSTDASSDIPSSKAGIDAEILLTSPAADLPIEFLPATENSTEIPAHPAVPNEVNIKSDISFDVPIEFETCNDEILLTKQTLVPPNVSQEGLANCVNKNENNLPKPKPQKKCDRSPKMEHCKPQLMEINESDRSLIGKRLIIPPAVLRASKRSGSLCSRSNAAESKTDNPINYPEVSVSSLQTIKKIDSLENLDFLRIKNLNSHLTKDTENKSKSITSIGNKNLECPATVIDKCVFTQDTNACMSQLPKIEISAEKKLQNESSKLNSVENLNPPKLKTVNIEFDETEFIDECVEAINIDEATLKSLEEQNNRIYTIKNEESPMKSDDDQLEKKTPNFDLKLLMQPIVYTTKIDDIEVLKNILSEQTVCLENIENFILSQTKPQVENSCKYFTEKLKSLNFSANYFDDKVVNDDKVLDDIIQLTSASVNNFPLFKHETAIEANPEVSCLPTFRNEGNARKVFDISHQMFQKPTYRTYTPIALCKHPDFNTRLKRLPVTFFLLPSNRQYLKTCKPLTIDLSKDFESKLVDGVMHVKSSFQANAKPIDIDTAYIAQTVSLTPVTPVAETAFENMAPEMIQSPEFTDTNNLLTQRKKPIELPDIEKVRAVNSYLKTAQVPPLQVIMKGTVDNTKVQPQKMFSADSDVTFGGNVKLYRTNKGEVTFAARDKNLGGTTTNYQPLKNRRLKTNVPFLAKKNMKFEECLITCDTLGQIFAELGYPEMQTGEFKKKKWKQKSQNPAANAEEQIATLNFCCWVAQDASTGPNLKDMVKHKFYCLEECTCCCKDKIFSGPKIDLVQSEKEIEDAVAGISNISNSKTPETPRVAVKVHHASPKTARKRITAVKKNITQRGLKDVSEQNNTPFCANKTSKDCEITTENLSSITDSQENCESLTERKKNQLSEETKVDCLAGIEETVQEKTQMPVLSSNESNAEMKNNKNTERCITSDIQEPKSNLIDDQVKIKYHKTSEGLTSQTQNNSCFKINDEADKAHEGQKRDECKKNSHSIDSSQTIETQTKNPESLEGLVVQTNNESSLEFNDEADKANHRKENEKSITLSHSINTIRNIETLADIIDLCDEEDNKIVNRKKKNNRTCKRKLDAQLKHEKQVQEWQAVKKHSRTAFGFSPHSPVKNYIPHRLGNVNNIISTDSNSINITNIKNAVIPDSLNTEEDQQILSTGKETFIIRNCKSRIPLALGESRILLTTANLISPPATSFLAPQDTSLASSSNKKLAGQIIMDSNICNVPQGTRIVILPTGQVTVVIDEGYEELTENQIKILQELIKITQSQVDNGLIEIPKVNEGTTNKESLHNKQESLLKTSYSLNPSTIVIDEGDETNVQGFSKVDYTKDEFTLGPSILTTKEDSIPDSNSQSSEPNTNNQTQNKKMTSLEDLQTEKESSPTNFKNEHIINSLPEHEPTNKSNKTVEEKPVEQPVNDAMDKNEIIKNTYSDHNYATVSKETQMIKIKDFATLTENIPFKKPKNILSDLMEISGITNEDSTDVSEVQPEICMPKISNVSIVATYLTPITSVAELHQSNLQNGQFYVFNNKTGALSSINVMHVNQTSLHSEEFKFPTLEVNPLPNVIMPLPQVRNNQANLKPIPPASRPKNPRKEKIDTRIEILDSDEPIIEEHLVSSDESETDLPDEIKEKVEKLLQRYKKFKSKARPKPFPIEFDNDSESDDEPLSVVAAKKNRPRKRKFSDGELIDKKKKCVIEPKGTINENNSATIGHEEVSIDESVNGNPAISYKNNVEKVDVNKQRLGENENYVALGDNKESQKIDPSHESISTYSSMVTDRVDEKINSSHSESDDCILGM